jgi:hypothetical protein
MTPCLAVLIISIASIAVQQTVPNPTVTGGVITGILKRSDGTPAVGVRVSARPRQTPGQSDETMVSQAESDASGRYILDKLPPGPYVIGAGRIGRQTYYPGTQVLSDASAVSISLLAGIDFTVTGIDFTVPDESLSLPRSFTIPIRLRIEGSDRSSVSPGTAAPRLRLMHEETGQFTTIVLGPTSTTVDLPRPVGSVIYFPFVEGIPAGYSLKSILYGTTDVKVKTLRLAATDDVLPSGIEVTLVPSSGAAR